MFPRETWITNFEIYSIATNHSRLKVVISSVYVSVVASSNALTSNKGCSDKLMSYTNKGEKGRSIVLRMGHTISVLYLWSPRKGTLRTYLSLRVPTHPFSEPGL